MSHRGVLTLDTGRVEADGGDALNLSLDVEHTLVVLLAGLRLGEVTGSERDWTDHSCRDQDVRSGNDLRTALCGWGGEYILSVKLKYVRCFPSDALTNIT